MFIAFALEGLAMQALSKFGQAPGRFVLLERVSPLAGAIFLFFD